MPHLTDAQLRYLMNVDQLANVALAAIDPSDGIVGVGRFVRLSRCEAEPAIAIADGYQGQGIGIALLRALTDCAQRRGVTRYRGLVLADNLAALRLLSGVGRVRSTRAGASLDVAVDLAAAAA